MIKEIIERINFFNSADRLGPDIPTTHWKLHFKISMKKICKKKFGKFEDDSEFRAGAYAVFCSSIFLGKRVVIRPGTMLFATPQATITIEDDVLLGSGVHIYVSNHKYDDISIPIMEQGWCNFKNVILRRGCWIGANAIILPGVEVGQNSVIAAGSVVTKSVPPGTLYGGNPARFIRRIAKIKKNK